MDAVWFQNALVAQSSLPTQLTTVKREKGEMGEVSVTVG